MTIKTAIVWANNLSNFSPGYLIFLLSSFPSRNRNLDAPSKRFYFPSFLLAFSIFFPEQSFSKMNNNNNSSLSCKSKHDSNFSFIHVCVSVFSLAFWGYSLIREWKCSIAQPLSLSLSLSLALSLSLSIYIYIYIYIYIAWSVRLYKAFELLEERISHSSFLLWPSDLFCVIGRMRRNALIYKSSWELLTTIQASVCFFAGCSLWFIQH